MLNKSQHCSNLLVALPADCQTHLVAGMPDPSSLPGSSACQLAESQFRFVARQHQSRFQQLFTTEAGLSPLAGGYLRCNRFRQDSNWHISSPEDYTNLLTNLLILC
jgi:hypothetical protein